MWRGEWLGGTGWARGEGPGLVVGKIRATLGVVGRGVKSEGPGGLFRGLGSSTGINTVV